MGAAANDGASDEEEEAAELFGMAPPPPHEGRLGMGRAKPPFFLAFLVKLIDCSLKLSHFMFMLSSA